MVRIGSQKFSYEEIEELDRLLCGTKEQRLAKLQLAIDSLRRKPEIAKPGPKRTQKSR